jgi:hypothetical protein
MTSTINPTSTHPTTVADIAPTAGSAPAPRPVPGGRWAYWGAAAGFLGFAGTILTDTRAPEVEGVEMTHEAIADLSHTGFHIGIVAGLAATFCLLVAAAGWKRWASANVPDSLAGRLVPMAMTASAGAMILGYGFKGSMAVYLPGGMDEGLYGTEALFPIYMFLDFGPWMAWWGVTFAALAMLWLSLKERALGRWIGYVTIPFVLAPLALLIGTGLPGFTAVDSLWLLVVSIGAAVGFGRRARAAAA